MKESDEVYEYRSTFKHTPPPGHGWELDYISDGIYVWKKKVGTRRIVETEANS